MTTKSLWSGQQRKGIRHPNSLPTMMLISSILRHRIMVVSIKALSCLTWLMEIQPPLGKTICKGNGLESECTTKQFLIAILLIRLPSLLAIFALRPSEKLCFKIAASTHSLGSLLPFMVVLAALHQSEQGRDPSRANPPGAVLLNSKNRWRNAVS